MKVWPMSSSEDSWLTLIQLSYQIFFKVRFLSKVPRMISSFRGDS